MSLFVAVPEALGHQFHADEMTTRQDTRMDAQLESLLACIVKTTREFERETRGGRCEVELLCDAKVYGVQNLPRHVKVPYKHY